MDDDPQKRGNVEWIYNQLKGIKCYDEKFQKDEYMGRRLGKNQRKVDMIFYGSIYYGFITYIQTHHIYLNL